jgi:hypothetical protein
LRRNSLLGNGLQQMLRYSDFLPDLARDYFLFFQKISLAMADKYCIMKAQEKRKERKRKKMTIQVQHTIRRLVARHGYSATFVQHMGEGISLYSIGGIMYRIRGDGTIL